MRSYSTKSRYFHHFVAYIVRNQRQIKWQPAAHRKRMAYTLVCMGRAIGLECKIRLASTFSQNLSSQTQAKLSQRSNKHQVLYISEHEKCSLFSMKAFVHFSVKVQRVKHSNPPLPNIQFWKKSSQSTTFAASLRVLPQLGLGSLSATVPLLW